jgi:hypothetical protein
MSEAQDILERARSRAYGRQHGQVLPVDYGALNLMVKRQRAALTRALNSGDAGKVVVACRQAVQEWSRPGAMWPDDWSRWQRALDDTLGFGNSVALEDLA